MPKPTTNTPTLRAASILAGAFVTAKRDDGTVFDKLRDDAPEWCRDAVREAHDDELPDDWRFTTCRALADALLEHVEYNDGEIDDDWQHEAVSGQADVYYSDLLDWLRVGTRYAYVDDAKRELGTVSDDFMSSIKTAQYYAISQMAGILERAVREAAEEIEQADDDAEATGKPL